MKKKLLALVLTTIATFALCGTSILASHKLPETSKVCDHTYTSYSHTGYYGSTYAGSHQLSDGRGCVQTRLIYYHKITCTLCGYEFATNQAIACTEQHSFCGSYIVNH